MCGKHAHPTREQATKHLSRNANIAARRKKGDYCVYFCQECDAWHIGRGQVWRKNGSTFRKHVTIRTLLSEQAEP